MQLRPHCH